ncbi:hypothetical protein BH23CHL2_BH23CHL2_03720 [soil metagenome]
MGLLNWLRRFWRDFLSYQPFTIADQNPSDDSDD